MFSLHSHIAILIHSSWAIFPVVLPMVMLPILQLYFQNRRRLSSPIWFYHMTPLSETWFSLHLIPGPSIQTSCSPFQSNWSHSHVRHARSCLSATLFFLNTWLSSIIGLNLLVLQSQECSPLFMKVDCDHSDTPQGMVPSPNVYNVRSN